LICRNALAQVGQAELIQTRRPNGRAAKEESMHTGSSLIDRIRAATASIARYFDDAAIRRDLREELTGLGRDDLDRVLAELGISRDELEIVIKNAPRSRMLFQSMLRRLGLEKRIGLAAPQLIRRIERRCATCSRQKECSDWLEKGAPGTAYRQFCPNAETFDNLTRGSRMV
jgi:hypothetical protein